MFKSKSIIVISFLTLTIVGVIATCNLINKFIPSPPPPPEPEPISSLLKSELCNKLDINSSEQICLSNKPVFAADAFSLFEKNFVSGDTSYEDVINSLNSKNIETIEPFFQSDFDKFISLGIPVHLQIDLAQNGINRIFFYGNHKSRLTSIVVIRPEKLTPLAKNTVKDLCEKLNLEKSLAPCTTDRTVYVQDFIPIFEAKFPINETIIFEVIDTLRTYKYTEPQSNYKFSFHFQDNVNSQVVFYFDHQRTLENMAFAGSFVPTHLDPTILIDLCNQLNIQMDSDKCRTNAQVYTTDLIKEIRATFPYGITTYEDVQAKIGKYQVRFNFPVRDGNDRAVTLSWYDFVGNNYTRIRFDFDTDFILTSIQFFSGGGS